MISEGFTIFATSPADDEGKRLALEHITQAGLTGEDVKIMRRVETSPVSGKKFECLALVTKREI